MTCKYSDTNQHDALYNIARAYPGGVEALALRMNKSANVLRNKLRPGITTHHTSFEEVSDILEMCEEANMKNAFAPLHAFNRRHGFVAFPMPSPNEMTTDDLTQSLCNAVKEFSEAAVTASGALADRNVSIVEFTDFEKQAHEALSAIHELKERMRAAAFPTSTGDASQS